MKFRVLYVGRGPKWLDAAVGDYVRRMPELELVRIRDTPNRSCFDRMIRSAGSSVVVMLDRRGKQLTTKELADRYRQWNFGGNDVSFLVGDSEGFSESEIGQGEFVWSLSPLTYPYSIARLVVCEQLYRARSIVNGHPYHRYEDC
ncbi:MAG: 23S rRNA (pseudouridine(1915)-N(3))-methyltransferase RlmH [Gammaproteobacteria bacterium]|nr:23S rRNA (pseudouridine(1915)-N(3))-methyltransferase RlmH [Gammaproteobacteria bacterium]